MESCNQISQQEGENGLQAEPTPVSVSVDPDKIPEITQELIKETMEFAELDNEYQHAGAYDQGFD
jgi:hypothetical protein